VVQVRFLDLIDDKKRGREHSPAEIGWLVERYVCGDIPDYQMAAWLMAVRFRGLTAGETEALTQAMAGSGEQLNLDGLPRPWVDKHSTGGVGDKLSLIVVPMLVAAGATVVKLSGRGLGHTGGTIDKLESIPGFRTSLSTAELLDCVRRAGGCIAAHSTSLVPADGKIYALRDATSTVDSLPLIASSIMSKKLACGADTIVLDVKAGRGAFLEDRAQALELARAMVRIAAGAGRRAVAVLTAMDQPLGMAVGNSVEVEEACEVLRGDGPPDVRSLSIALAAEGLHASGLADSPAAAAALARRMLGRGKAMEKLEGMVSAQGGDPAALSRPGAMPRSPFSTVLRAPAAGTVAGVDALAAGQAAVLLGAGRSHKEEAVDAGAGIVFAVRKGDVLKAGDRLATVYAANAQRLEAGLARLNQAFSWAHETGEVHPPVAPSQDGLVLDVVRQGSPAQKGS
jgi:pyrimidine-nucleoside phosphorylase